MSCAIFAYSRQGCRTARRIAGVLGGQCFTLKKFDREGFSPLEPGMYGRLFSQGNCLIFVGSCGIALRCVAPFVADKQRDPAVLCVDELGRFVIPLLCGHIGGANALARTLAKELGATAVITTATDINGKFSADAWAAENGCAISDMGAAKAVSAAILEGDVAVESDFPIATALPAGLVPGHSGPMGICLSCHIREPFATTLRLIPPVLRLGIGCRKGTEAAAIEQAVAEVLEKHRLDRRAIESVSTIDLKSGEPGLLEYCRGNGWPLHFYSAEALNTVAGTFTPSEFVHSITGVDNVCERAALMDGQRLIVKKTACNGITVALAEKYWEVHFGESDRCGHRPGEL